MTVVHAGTQSAQSLGIKFVNGGSSAVSFAVLSLESTASDLVAPFFNFDAKTNHSEFYDETGRAWTNQQLSQYLNEKSTPSEEPDVPFDFDPDDYPVY